MVMMASVASTGVPAVATVHARDGVGVELFHPHNVVKPQHALQAGPITGDVRRVIADVIAQVE